MSFVVDNCNVSRRCFLKVYVRESGVLVWNVFSFDEFCKTLTSLECLDGFRYGPKARLIGFGLDYGEVAMVRKVKSIRLDTVLRVHLRTNLTICGSGWNKSKDDGHSWVDGVYEFLIVKDQLRDF